MRLLLIIISVSFSLMSVGCAETPAEKAATGYHADARWSRGGPQNGYDFMLWPKERERLIREINQIPVGATADQVIAELGQPDSDYPTFENIFSRNHGRELTYYFAAYRTGLDTEGQDQCVYLCFGNDNKYGSYFTTGNFELKRFGP